MQDDMQPHPEDRFDFYLDLLVALEHRLQISADRFDPHDLNIILLDFDKERKLLYRQR